MEIKTEIALEHTCDVCGKSFPRKAGLGTHKWTKHNVRTKPSKSYSCPVCAKVIRGSSKYSLEAHMKSHEAGFPFKCEQCGEGYKRPENLKKHQLLHLESRQRLKCELCPNEYANLRSLERHIIAVHVVDKEFQCSICNRAFINESELERHKRDKHERTYDCDMCPKQLTSKAGLRRHLERIHSRTEVCMLCIKSFPRKQDYQQHVQEDESESVLCPDPSCKLEFRTACLADQHWSEVHKSTKQSGTVTEDRCEEETATFDCDSCEKSFTSHRHLNSHMTHVHTKDKWECQVCHKTFKQRGEYNGHKEKSHLGEGKHKCQVCFKLYRSGHYLKVHMKNHGTDKPHKCSKCPKSYITSGSLRYHLLHCHGAGKKPYKCPHCPMRFVNKSALETEHIPSHFNAARFLCDTCSKRFKTKASMLQHKRLSCCPTNEKKSPTIRKLIKRKTEKTNKCKADQ